jgi:hypothetical protein
MRTAPLAAGAIVVGLFAWLFGPVLVGDRLFAFRDVAHFYYPLFEYVHQSLAAGQAPLWNPLENLGQPLAGNPTASVFYPGKLLFWLPLEYDRAFGLYLAAHWLLAVAGAFLLARHWKGSFSAAATAAIAYAMSGAVLFTVTNVIYLVGAAWLPLAWLAADRMLRCRSVQAAVGLGAVLALMILGGDPQAAYHAGLWMLGYAFWIWWDQRSGGLRRFLSELTRSPRVLGQVGLMGLAAVVAAALAAVQLVPSLQWAGRSDRAANTAARSLYEIPGQLGRDDAGQRIVDGLLYRNVESGSHHAHVFQFSVGPWRLAEMVWPNCGGRQFPTHRRWFQAIPAEGRVWTPSLYLGLLPLLLAIAALRLRGGSARANWLSWFALLAILGSFGWFGLGWLLEEVRLATAGGPHGEPLIGPPVGGVYWLLTVVLPGYVQFRYPAKLLVPAALAFCMLAAEGFDSVFGRREESQAGAGPTGRLRVTLLVLVVATATLATGVGLAGGLWQRWLADAEPNVLFGPLDVAGARIDLLGALLQTTVSGTLIWLLLGWAHGRRRWPAHAAIVLVAVDLVLAQSWMLPTAPRSLWHAPSAMGQVVDGTAAPPISESGAQAGRATEAGIPPRVLRERIWLPEAWSQSRSCDRLAEAVAWDRDTLWPKYPLSLGLASARVAGAMMSQDYQVYLNALDALPPAEAAGLLAAGWAVMPGDRELPGAEEIQLARAARDATLWQIESPLPRAWIARRLVLLPPLESRDPASVAERTRKVLFTADGRPRDLHREAVVETALPLAESGSRGAVGRDERCRIIQYGPNRVDLEVDLHAPGLVVLAEQFAPGWQLRAKTADGHARRLAILRTNRVMRGAWLPAGRFLLSYEYRPRWFRTAAVISMACWGALAVLAMVALARSVGELRSRTAPG